MKVEKRGRKTTIRACALLVLALFLSAVTPVGANAGMDPAESRTWRTIVDGIKSDIKIREAQLAVISEDLPGLEIDLQQGLAKADNRLDQIMMLSGVAGRTPWAYRTIVRQLKELVRYLDLKKEPLLARKKVLNRIKTEYSAIKSIRKRGDEDYAEATRESLEKPTVDYRSLKRHVNEVKGEVDADLQQADNLIAEVGEAITADEQTYVDIFLEYYFSRSDSLFSFNGLKSIGAQAVEWSNNCPRYWAPLIGWVQWGEFFLYFLGISLALLLLGLWVVAALVNNGKTSREHAGAYRTGWVFTALGLGMHFAMSCSIFTANHLTSFLWLSLLTLGLMIIAVTYARVKKTFAAKGLFRTTIFTLWLLFVGGAFLQIVNMPSAVISLVWFFLPAAAIWRLLRIKNGAATDLERGAATWSIWTLTLAAVASPFGFGPQSLIFTQIWFMLLLTVLLCSLVKAVITALANIRRKQAAEADGDVTGGSYVTLAYPFALAVIYYLFFAWALLFMGGPPLVDWVLVQKITLGAVSLSLDSIAFIFIVFFLLRLVLSWFKTYMDTATIRGRKMEGALAHTIKTLASYVVWVAFIIVGLKLLGVQLSALTWIASGLSVGIGFGMKDIINNFISGLIIMFGGSIKKGDILQQGKNLGEVVNVSIRNTTMRTLENTVVIIPNSSFLKGEIINFSYQDAKVRLSIPVSVVPGTKTKKVRKILLKIAKKQEGVLADPKPEVLFSGFSMFGLDFMLNVWIEDYMKKFHILDEMSEEIDKQFQAKKIKIAFRTIKTKYKPKGDEAAQLEARREELREKRKNVFKRQRHLRRTHARKRWNMAGFVAQPPE